jgi:hypothetical protein
MESMLVDPVDNLRADSMEECDWTEESKQEHRTQASSGDGANASEGGKSAAGRDQETTEDKGAMHASASGHDLPQHTVNGAYVAQQDAVNSLSTNSQRRWLARQGQRGTPVGLMEPAPVGLKEPVTTQTQHTRGDPNYKTQIEEALRIAREAKRSFVHCGVMSSESLGCLPNISLKGMGRIALPLCAQQAGQ